MKTIKRKHSKKESGGYIIVLVMTVLLALTSLGVGAVIMSGADAVSTGAEVQRTAARFCAEYGMTRLVNEMYHSDSSMSVDYVDLQGSGGTLTLPVDNNGETATYTYWYGHYGQSGQSYSRVFPISSQQNSAIGFTENAGVNLTNVMSNSGKDSVTRYYSVVVTCQAPNGSEVELQSLIKRGI